MDKLINDNIQCSNKTICKININEIVKSNKKILNPEY